MDRYHQIAITLLPRACRPLLRAALRWSALQQERLLTIRVGLASMTSAAEAQSWQIRDAK